MRDLKHLDLHDAVLESLVVSWELGHCVAHLRMVGADGGRPIELRWHGLRELTIPRAQPWGPSASVLRLNLVADDTTELLLQTGDTIRVVAKGRDADERESVPQRYADLAVDALVDAKLVDRGEFSRAAHIVAVEIAARRGLGDA